MNTESSFDIPCKFHDQKQIVGDLDSNYHTGNSGKGQWLSQTKSRPVRVKLLLDCPVYNVPEQPGGHRKSIRR